VSISNAILFQTRTPRTRFYVEIYHLNTIKCRFCQTRKPSCFVIELEYRLNLLTRIANFYHMTVNSPTRSSDIHVDFLNNFLRNSFDPSDNLLFEIRISYVQYLFVRSRWDYPLPADLLAKWNSWADGWTILSFLPTDWSFSDCHD
jgi:hypothetical protein